jgi:hypothetical protein
MSEGLQASRRAAQGLCLKRTMTFDEWAALGHRIAVIASASAWSLGDWLNFGEKVFGKRYRTAIDATHFDYQTLRNYAWVARSFAVSRRRDTLSFAHHAEVAALPEPAQELWLSRAEKGRWSRGELRGRLRAERRALAGARDALPVVVRVEVQPEQERRWREAAAANRLALADWLASTMDAAANEVLTTGEPSRAVGRAREQSLHRVQITGGLPNQLASRTSAARFEPQ